MSGFGGFPSRHVVGVDDAIITAHLRNNTAHGSPINSCPDLLNNNPAIQHLPPDVAPTHPVPTSQTSVNGHLCMNFTPKIAALAWTLTPRNNSVNQWGIACWFTPESITKQTGIYLTSILDYNVGPGGSLSSASKIIICSSAAGKIKIYIKTGASAGKFFNTVSSIVAGPNFLTVEYNKDGGPTDNNKLIVTLGTNLITPTLKALTVTGTGTLDALWPTTGQCMLGTGMLGHVSLGGFDTPANSGTTKIGPDIWIIGRKMPDATEGLLTVAKRNELWAQAPPG